MSERQKITPKVQAEVLLKSGRRCCLCYGLHRDINVKKGQIAHLDKNRSVNSVSNLVFLCFDHHDEFDSTTRQSKGLTSTEVAKYRTQLHDFVRISLSLESVSRDFVATSIESQEIVLETIERYWHAGHTSPNTIASEIHLRVRRVRDFHRLFERETSKTPKITSDDEEERHWNSTMKRLRKTLALPEGIGGLLPDGEISAGEYRELRELATRWARGKLSYEKCGRLHWLLDEDLDFDQYFVLYGLPLRSIGALGIAALDSFLYAFGMRNTQPS